MRPRLFTAENHGTQRLDGGEDLASMRPRLFTAENGLVPQIAAVVRDTLQ